MRIALRLPATPLALALALALAVPPAVTPAVTPVPATGGHAEPCHGTAPADFNGDGSSDLAVGAPYAAVDGHDRAGAVAVRHGRRRAAPDGEVMWLSQRTPDAPDGAERGDGFGAALATGDFDGDRCGDLVVGVPGEVLGAARPGADGNGAVQVFLGSPHGLRAAAMLSARTLGRTYGSDRFGAALTAADLDGDGDDEVAVGAPGLAGGGGVAVFGLRGAGLGRPRLITQRTTWVGERPAQTDGFGTTLATGDFDGDGRTEIAVGAPGDGPRSEGSVTVLGPMSRTARNVSQAGPGISGDPETGDRFGAALTAGDFDADGRDDLAVGVPGEDLNAMPASDGFGEGAVHVLYGPALSERGPMWSRSGRRVSGNAGRYDHFGAALAAGDLDGDGAADLAVGAPGRGAVHVLRGARRKGLSGARDVVITSTLGSGAQFGWSLLCRRHGPGRVSDLLVGAPGAYGFGGAITPVPGSPRGPRGGVADSTGDRMGDRQGHGLIGYSLG